MLKRTGREFKVLALIFGPLLILFVVLSAFQYHNYSKNRSRVRLQLERRQDLVTELAAARLQSYTREITSTLDRLSVSLGSSKKISEKYEDIGKAFDSLGGKVERLSYIDGEGRKAYSVLGKGTLMPLPENCRYEDFFTGPKLARVPFISTLAGFAGKEEVIYFSYPVKDASTRAFAGVVLAQVSRSSFAGVCKHIKEIDPDIRFAYYGQQGDRICLDGCLPSGGSHARKELMSDAPASEVVPAGASRPGARVVYYPVRIEGYRWYMTSEMPLSLVDSLAAGDTLAYSAAGAFFVFFLISGGLYFHRVYMGKAAAESEAAYQASVAAKHNAFEAERDKLLAVLNGVPDGILLLDVEGRVIDANASIRSIAGMPAEGPLGNIPEGSVLDVFLGPLDEPVDKAVGDRTYRIIPVPSSKGVGGSPAEVRVVRDVSRERAIEHKREDMASMITHDIKNPLTAIIGMSEWLASDKIKPCLGDDGAAAVEAINRAATRILALSENFLLLSSAEGMHRLKKTPAEIGAFLEKVIAEFYLEAAQKGITIRHNLGEVSVRILVDETQMMRAFSNLINNSLRHTPSGGTITVTAKDVRSYVTVSISDTGPGVSKSDLPHVFEKNYRAYDGKERARKAGLGLSIAKSIIEAHGGTIEFVSDEQSAAMFVVRLPLPAQA